MLLLRQGLLLYVLSVVSAGAPEDADQFCIDLPATAGIEPGALPSHAAILMGSYNYLTLLVDLDDVITSPVSPVWQGLDLDTNNAGGRGTRVSRLVSAYTLLLGLVSLCAVGSAL